MKKKNPHLKMRKRYDGATCESRRRWESGLPPVPVNPLTPLRTAPNTGAHTLPRSIGDSRSQKTRQLRGFGVQADNIILTGSLKHAPLFGVCCFVACGSGGFDCAVPRSSIVFFGCCLSARSVMGGAVPLRLLVAAVVGAAAATSVLGAPVIVPSVLGLSGTVL